MRTNITNRVSHTSYFGKLMSLYKMNYRLMQRLNIFNGPDEIKMQLEQDNDPLHPLPGYRLHIKRLEKRSYTEVLQLTYNVQKHQLDKPAPLMRISTDIYHDSRQVGAIVVTHYNPKYTPFALRVPLCDYLQSLSQKKYYTNSMLHSILKRFTHCDEADNISKLQYSIH